jgi:hypothetical protein
MAENEKNINAWQAPPESMDRLIWEIISMIKYHMDSGEPLEKVKFPWGSNIYICPKINGDRPKEIYFEIVDQASPVPVTQFVIKFEETEPWRKHREKITEIMSQKNRGNG